MKLKKNVPLSLTGAAAGAVNGLLGAGGGMVLVPLLTTIPTLEDREVFPASVAIILPICMISLFLSPTGSDDAWNYAWPYLIGSAIGGILAGFLGKRIPTKWLHRALGVLILWGGIRYLC